MLKKLKNWWYQEGFDNLRPPKNLKCIFSLVYKNLEIGRLILEEGIWTFRYSKQFKDQDLLPPLIDFPNLNKEYKSEELWPIFASRIPSLNQPLVQQIITRDGIDKNNEAELLKRFGKHSISNPFVLEDA